MVSTILRTAPAPAQAAQGSGRGLAEPDDGGGRIVSLNGSDWHCGALSFTEQCIDSVLSAGLVTVVQCGPDLLLALHLELTAAYWQTDARPLPNPWSGSEYGAVYDKMHRLNRYAIRELTGVEQRNLLDAVQAAMNHTADDDKLRALDGIAHEIGLVTS